MYNILHNSKTGMIANQNKIDITSNNIANAQTSGYKKLDVGFLDLYTETLNRTPYPINSKDAFTGTGVKSSLATRDSEQGSLKNTGIKTNLAIDGEGFFKIVRPDKSIAYTRNGEFNIDSSGQLVDDRGNILDVNFIDKGKVDLSNGDLSINKAGEVFINREKVGKIDLYTSVGDKDFVSIGDNLFAQKKGARISAVKDSSILQGHVEMSNVSMETEMTNLIIAQRAFQFNSKGVNAIDEMWSMVNNLQSR